MKIPKDIEVKLNRMQRLEIKENELSFEADAIVSTSAMGQAPYCYYNTLDKMLKINQKRTEIWNDIRNRITNKGKTLWQLAVKNKLSVKTYGKEYGLDINSKDIRELFM